MKERIRAKTRKDLKVDQALMNPFVWWRMQQPELEEDCVDFVVIPRIDSELEAHTDDQLAALLTEWLNRTDEERREDDKIERREDGSVWVMPNYGMACCRLLEQRGRRDLLRKCTGRC